MRRWLRDPVGHDLASPTAARRSTQTPGAGAQRAQALHTLQRTIGNRALLRLLAGDDATTAAGAPAGGAGHATVARAIPAISAVAAPARGLVQAAKPKRPGGVSAGEKDALEGAVRRGDATAFTPLAQALYTKDATYFERLLAYKLAKHATNPAKRTIWLNASPPAAVAAVTGPAAPPPLIAAPVAPTPPLAITHQTTRHAPDGTADTRTRVGVGEEVQFTGNQAGIWSSTTGTAAPTGARTDFTWTAPERGVRALIELTTGAEDADVDIDVVEPDRIDGVKQSELAYTGGKAGAGMILSLHHYPKDVSFAEVQSKEVPGAASNVTGYFAAPPYGAAALFHNSSNTFHGVGPGHDAIHDRARTPEFDPPFSAGGFDWLIPNRFKVSTEGGNGKLFTTVTQSFTMDDAGKVKVTKAGAEVERSP